MTGREMQIAFDATIQLAGKDYEVAEKPDSFTIFQYLNLGQEVLIKTRYSGWDVKGESFEQTQKRTDDLRTLVKEADLTTSAGTNKPNSYVVVLPADYMITVGEEVTIKHTDSVTSTEVTKRTGITDCTTDTYSRKLYDPYSEHYLHYGEASPLRLFIGNNIEFITDGNYTVEDCHLRYLKLPQEIGPEAGEDCELPEHMHMEIVTKAVSLFLEASADQRYQSSVNELRQQE